eukprot:7460701-Pyramimonas_sp.AAC.1
MRESRSTHDQLPPTAHQQSVGDNIGEDGALGHDVSLQMSGATDLRAFCGSLALGCSARFG